MALAVLVASAWMLVAGTRPALADADDGIPLDGAIEGGDEGAVVAAPGSCSESPFFDPATDVGGSGCLEVAEAQLEALSLFDGIEACNPDDARYPRLVAEPGRPGAVVVEDCGALCAGFPIPPPDVWHPPLLQALLGDAAGDQLSVCTPANPAFGGFALMRCPADLPEDSRWLYDVCVAVASGVGAFLDACAVMPAPVARVCEAAAVGGELACCDAVLNTLVPPSWRCALETAAQTAPCAQCCFECCDAAWPVAAGDNVLQNTACKGACAVTPVTTTTVTSTTSTSTTEPSTTSTSTTQPSTTSTSTTTVSSTTSTTDSSTTTSTEPSTTTITFASTTTTVKPSTTTSTIPKDCASASITLPTKLPDQNKCAGNTPTDCNDWTPVGRTYAGAREMAVTPWETARLYEWSDPSGKTTCLYLYRTEGGGTFNGAHCYHVDSCDVCAFDFKGAPPTWAQLEPLTPTSKMENCSSCHAAGPIVPMKAFLDGVSSATESLNVKCASVGGPQWIAAPADWTQRDTALHVAAPGKCAGCHSGGFVRQDPLFVSQFCDTVAGAAFGPDGGMELKKFDDKDAKNDRKLCENFTKAMGCTKDVFRCAGRGPKP